MLYAYGEDGHGYYRWCDARYVETTFGVRVYANTRHGSTYYFFPYEPEDGVGFDCSVYDDLSMFELGCEKSASKYPGCV